MKVSRIINWLKMLTTILVTLGISSIIIAVIYIHHYGLPKNIIQLINDELEKKQVYIKCESIKYQLTRGAVLEDVIIYKDAKKLTPILKFDSLNIEFDKSKLLRNEFEIDSAEITDGVLHLNLTPDLEKQTIIKLEEINGEFSFSAKKQIETDKGVSFIYKGIKTTLIGSYLLDGTKKKKNTLEQQKKAAEQYNKFLDIYTLFSFPDNTTPELTIGINGKASKMKNTSLALEVKIPKINYKSIHAKNLLIKGMYKSKLLHLDHLTFDDEKGYFKVQADYSLVTQKGNFQIDSSIDFKTYIREFGSTDFANDVEFSGDTAINANGSIAFTIDDTLKADVKLLGDAKLTKVKYLEAEFDYLGTKFSWRDDSLYLTNLQAFIGESEFNGRLLMNPNEIKFSTNSSLSPQILRPFLKGKSFEKALDRVKMNGNSICNISATGSVNVDDITQWQADGDIYLASIQYKNTKISEAGVNFKLSNQLSIYENPFIAFDHTNYKKQKKYQLADTGNATAESIIVIKNVDTGYRSIRVNNLSGKLWITPVLNMFSSQAAKTFRQMNLQSPVQLNKSQLQIYHKNPTFYTQGELDLKHVKLSGYDLNNSTFNIDLKNGISHIKNIKTQLDYSNYPKEKALDQKTPADITIGSVSIVQNKLATPRKQIKIKDIQGHIWPAPATALFAKKSEQAVEDINFTRPVYSKKSNLTFTKEKGSWTNLFELDCHALAYNGVNATNATGTVAIKKGITTFDNTKLTIDFSNYSKKKSYGGPANGTLQVNHVKIGKNEVYFNGLKGLLWPCQITSMFNKTAGETIHDLNFTSPLNSLGSDMHFSLEENNNITGLLNIGNMQYNKTPLTALKTNISITDNKLTFDKITTTFDHTNDSIRKEFNGPKSSSANANKITYNIKDQIVTIDNLTGKFWPGSAVSLFTKDIAKEVNEFRFTSPPFSTTSGKIDISPSGENTLLNSTLKAGQFTYNFLDEDIPGISANANIRVDSNKIDVTELKLELLGSRTYKGENGKIISPASGNFSYNFSKNTPTYSGEIAINRISLKSIAETFDFESVNKGFLSTLFQFTGDTNGISNLNTKKENSFFIQSANLAKIPLLGPFSKLTSALSKNKNTGYTEISDAKGFYSIKNGKLIITGLEAKSNSLTLSGKGTYNMDSERVDMRFSIQGFKKAINFLELIRPLIQNFPIVQGAMKYKVYGHIEDIKILPDISSN